MKRPAFSTLLLHLTLGLALTACDTEIPAQSTLLAAKAPPAPPSSRDPLQWPFSISSIWNVPIGSGAIYRPANLSPTPGNEPWAPMPFIDNEIIVLEAHAPLTPIYLNDSGWSGKDRCKPTGGVLIEVPIPADFVVPNNRNNNSAVFLAQDGHTLIHAQPFTRCGAGQPATSLLTFQTVDLYGDGRYGSHGGSKLSAIGGSIRLGELRPGGQGPRHALKVDVWGKGQLYPCQQQADCSRWPALTADNGASKFYGREKAKHLKGNKTDPSAATAIAADGPDFAMRMGALLAIPASVSLDSLALETEPGKMLAWTFQNYGAYIVDDTGGAAFALAVEHGSRGSLRTQFKKDWGYDMEQRVRDNTPWVRDIQRIVKNLHVVDNNGPGSIGGGGQPLQPLAPPFK
jgi:hypothetical protein